MKFLIKYNIIYIIYTLVFTLQNGIILYLIFKLKILVKNTNNVFLKFFLQK